MDHRSSTKRLFALTPAALSWIVLVPFVLTGCQSNAQQDIVARELRMQEDQLYAMEDYLTQYQQLICKYRSENVALRRRLSDGYYDEGEEVPAPRSVPRTKDSRPAIDAPQTPPRDLSPPPPDEVELPDVPALEGSTSNSTNLKFMPSSADKHDAPESKVLPAAHEEADATDEPSAATEQRTTSEPATRQQIDESLVPHSDMPVEHVWLHGEIVENDEGGGPRITVDVEPLDATGRCSSFDGQLSLMLIAPNGDGGQQNLARWDFRPEEIQSAVDSESGEERIRFYLELPPEKPVATATQLWARLVPSEGVKVLSHADVDLQKPGEFSSRRNTALAANIPARITSKLIEGDWTTARPGEPANLSSSEDTARGDWRASTEPIPVIVQAKAPAARASQSVQHAMHNEPQNTSNPKAYKRPSWSADRSHMAVGKPDSRAAQQRSIAQRPTWSQTR